MPSLDEMRAEYRQLEARIQADTERLSKLAGWIARQAEIEDEYSIEYLGLGTASHTASLSRVATSNGSVTANGQACGLHRLNELIPR